MNQIEIDEIIKCIDLNEMKSIEEEHKGKNDKLRSLMKNNIKVFHDVDLDDLDLITNILDVAKENQIVLFYLIRQKIDELNVQSKIKLPEFFSSVLEKSLTSYESLSQWFFDGTILLEEFERLASLEEKRFKPTNKMNLNWEIYVRKLLEYSCSDSKLIDQRMSQLRIYTEMSTINSIAHVLLQLVQKCGLNGDFFVLEEITDSVI